MMPNKEKLIRKLFAGIDDEANGNKDPEYIGRLYLNHLKKSGVPSTRIIIPEEDYSFFRRKSGIKAIAVTGREVVNHQPYVSAEVALLGISDLNAKQVLQVIKGEMITWQRKNT